jgi:hypothetical protein
LSINGGAKRVAKLEVHLAVRLFNAAPQNIF